MADSNRHKMTVFDGGFVKKRTTIPKTPTRGNKVCAYPGCMQNFSRMSDLKRHMITHDKTGRYHVYCVCGKFSTNQMSNLTDHILERYRQRVGKRGETIEGHGLTVEAYNELVWPYRAEEERNGGELRALERTRHGFPKWKYPFVKPKRRRSSNAAQAAQRASPTPIDSPASTSSTTPSPPASPSHPRRTTSWANDGVREPELVQGSSRDQVYGRPLSPLYIPQQPPSMLPSTASPFVPTPVRDTTLYQQPGAFWGGLDYNAWDTSTIPAARYCASPRLLGDVTGVDLSIDPSILLGETYGEQQYDLPPINLYSFSEEYTAHPYNSLPCYDAQSASQFGADLYVPLVDFSIDMENFEFYDPLPE